MDWHVRQLQVCPSAVYACAVFVLTCCVRFGHGVLRVNKERELLVAALMGALSSCGMTGGGPSAVFALSSCVECAGCAWVGCTHVRSGCAVCGVVCCAVLHVVRSVVCT